MGRQFIADHDMNGGLNNHVETTSLASQGVRYSQHIYLWGAFKMLMEDSCQTTPNT